MNEHGKGSSRKL